MFNEHNLRDISSGQRGQRGQRGLPGEPDRPGIGFKLMPDGKNYDMYDKKICNLARRMISKLDYDTMVKDLKSAVNKTYLNQEFLKKDKDGNYLDLRQK